MKSLNSHARINYQDAIRKFMKEKNWTEYRCDKCGISFFRKSAKIVNIPICGWKNCKSEYYSFHELSKRKSIIKPEAINLSISRYFGLNGYNHQKPLNIANQNGLTDLVVAGVQMFDDVIHQGKNAKLEKVFVAQPCVRMQFGTQVKELDGISTSFVNICTEQIGASLADHLDSFDHWCTIFSHLGLFMNDFTVIMVESTSDWGTGEFDKIELFLLYGDLELGDASYFNIPRKDKNPITISDIGFGLERVAWALNKSKTYFDYLVPIAYLGGREMFDPLRTLSLLVTCGVKASNKGPGLQFRRFAKVISEKYCSYDIYEIVSFYYDYWSSFVEPVVSKKEAILAARMEIERLLNLRISKMLDLPLPHNETTDAYLNRLVYTLNISIYDLKEAIRVCKT